ncbi:vi polysaccharide biosynthesis vipa tvib [Purpureocillium lavendulum]|uniref:Vi polysaccharide biosynthesis vipa tvib n=1 Tax=Purpureocillium lavendulum TaxID=1247861 RepID=A0AB34FTB5_9HYPO|nr:vi polysaccharide biosynthesis vipa tvib [Purpureocillium lavendulum]
MSRCDRERLTPTFITQQHLYDNHRRLIVTTPAAHLRGPDAADHNAQAAVDDAHLSLRFKHGIHTVYLFVDALAPMSNVTQLLREVLRERYPSGLTTSVAPPEQTLVPADAKLAYAVLAVPNDPSRGWRRIKVGADEENTPTKCNLKDNDIIAFAIIDADQQDDEDEVRFEVEWPRVDDELYEEGG